MMNLFFFILGLIMGGFITHIVIKHLELKKMEKPSFTKSKKVTKSPTIKPKHIKPETILYEGGFTKVTKCKECGRTAHSSDQFFLHPCPECGGKILSGDGTDFIAKWCKYENQYQWLNKLDFDTMSEEEKKQQVRRRKINRIVEE